MAIRAFIATEHLPQSNQAGAQGTGYGLAQLAFGSAAGSNAGSISASKATIGDLASGIQLSIGSNVNASAAYMQIPASAVTDGVSDTSYIGFALKPSLYTTAQGGAIAMFSFAGITFYPATLGLTVGPTSDYWIEFAVDRINNQIQPFVDGKPYGNTIAFAAGAYSGANNIQFGGTTAFNWYGQINYHFSHVYFIDDTKDSTPCTRLGPSQLSICPATAVVGSDYTTSDGSTPLNVLNTPLSSAAALTAPVINTPASGQGLDCSFSTSLDQYSQIKAVAFLISAKKNPVTDTAFKVSLKNGSDVVQGPMMSFANNNLLYSQSLGVQNKAPDGGSWTAAKLLATTVSLMPVNLTP